MLLPVEDVNKTTQNSIVTVLDSIQKKMTINRQINQNLATPDRSLGAAGVRRAA